MRHSDAMDNLQRVDGNDVTGVSERLAAILCAHAGRTFTGAVLRVEAGGTEPIEIALGTLDPETGEAVEPHSRFDLASITKLFTGSAILRLVAAQTLTLDEPVASVLPGFTGPGKPAVTLRQLLTHSSGLPALIRLYGSATVADPWEAILALPLAGPPGSSVVYSDVGFMLLGRVIEQVTGSSLREAVGRLVLDPLGLHDVEYGPVPDAAATEFESWRGRRIRGEVHDENAAVLGGAAGHAGLFGPARAVSALARAYLGDGENFLPDALARTARSEQSAWGEARRGLGWALRSPAPGASEAAFSADAFGHYGFTGTAVWADPRRDIIAVLLTNRVYFGRDPAGIQALRREVFRAVADRFPPQYR